MYYNDIELIVTQIKDISSKRRLIYINYEPAFALYNSEIRKYNIEPEHAVSYETLMKIDSEVLYKRALTRAVSLLKDKDYTEYELKNKLKKSYYSDYAVDNVIEYAKQHRYVDDERYAYNYINFKSGTKSRYQIMYFLKNKGISKSIIDSCCEEFYAENGEVELNSLIDKIKRLNIPAEDFSYEKKCKIINKFYRKGFNVDLIKKALDIVFADVDNY